MNTQEFAKRSHELTTKRHELLIKLIAPARAAANAMQDAGMKRTADPLNEILFELDVLDSELASLLREDGAVEALMQIVRRRYSQ
jgi:hypothetical protein